MHDWCYQFNHRQTSQTVRSSMTSCKITDLIYLQYEKYRTLFIKSASAQYLHASCWRIRNWTSEPSEQLRFLIQKRQVCRKHFSCAIVFTIYILRQSSFWWPFYFNFFQNARICCYTPQNFTPRNQSISLLVKVFVKIKRRIRIWGNKRTIRNLNCLFWIYNIENE